MAFDGANNKAKRHKHSVLGGIDPIHHFLYRYSGSKQAVWSKISHITYRRVGRLSMKYMIGTHFCSRFQSLKLNNLLAVQSKGIIKLTLHDEIATAHSFNSRCIFGLSPVNIQSVTQRNKSLTFLHHFCLFRLLFLSIDFNFFGFFLLSEKKNQIVILLTTYDKCELKILIQEGYLANIM